MAREIGQWPEYKIFYRPFSHTVHGTDPLRLLEVKGEGDVRFGALRTTDEQEFLVGLAEAVLHMAGSTLAKHYFPELSNSHKRDDRTITEDVGYKDGPRDLPVAAGFVGHGPTYANLPDGARHHGLPGRAW